MRSPPRTAQSGRSKRPPMPQRSVAEAAIHPRRSISNDPRSAVRTKLPFAAQTVWAPPSPSCPFHGLQRTAAIAISPKSRQNHMGFDSGSAPASGPILEAQNRWGHGQMRSQGGLCCLVASLYRTAESDFNNFCRVRGVFRAVHLRKKELEINLRTLSC